MAKVKHYTENERTQLRGELFLIIPARKEGFPSDARALRAVSDINKQGHINAVACDQQQPYSLVYRYCVKHEIDFFSRGQNLQYNPSCLDDLLSSYQISPTHPKIVYLTHSNDYKTLSTIAKNLSARGVKTEIRKVF